MAKKRKMPNLQAPATIVVRTTYVRKMTIAQAAKRRGLRAASWLVTLGLLEASDDMRLFNLVPPRAK